MYSSCISWAGFIFQDVGGEAGLCEDLALALLLLGELEAAAAAADNFPPLLLLARGTAVGGGGGNSEGSEYHGSIPDTCRSRALCHML